MNTGENQPLTDSELQLRAQIDRLCAQRAELSLIIKGLRAMLPRRPQSTNKRRAMSIGELARKEGLL